MSNKIAPPAGEAGKVDSLGIRWIGPNVEKNVKVVAPERQPQLEYVVVEDPKGRDE